MYLNLCNAKFSIVDVEKRVFKEMILSLHFSIASFNMRFTMWQPANHVKLHSTQVANLSITMVAILSLPQRLPISPVSAIPAPAK